MQTQTAQSKDPVFVPQGAGDRLRILGSVHVNKATPDQTGGAFSALEVIVPPGMGPPMHSHADDCEFFYVLEGEFTFSHPGGSIVGRKGDFCFLPTGGHHAWRNSGGTEARALVVIAPGIEAHAFFNALDKRLEGAVDGAVALELGQKNGIVFD